ncbi:steroid 17-alpha-hydroxylase/17,20 lyase-like [Clytia hemisphaerica]|uniref:Uncharacterized protein n=1 Tax=Clytia hemisphaerica TaxID=252671 RepID=A0A7M5WXU7_9CNID
MHKMFEEHIASFNPEKIRDVTDNLIAFSQNKQLLESVEIQDWTQKDILEAVIPSLFFAAVETSLTTIRWCLIYLIRNPHVQTKIYEEILQNVGLKRQTEAADVDSLPFVQAVMLETNRRASILPINVPHKTLVDTSVVGKTVPKDTRVFFNLYSMHHDPTHWDEPGKFKPERWLNADGSLKKEKATHYLPFGAGIRVCLGERMAKMQMFLIVTRLLTNFEISLAPGETLPGSEDGVLGITLQPPPFKMILNTRKIE